MLLAGQHIGQILLVAVVEPVLGGCAGHSVRHARRCVRGGPRGVVRGIGIPGARGEKLPQTSAETFLELPEPGLGRAGVRRGARDGGGRRERFVPWCAAGPARCARGVQGQCDHRAIMRGEDQPPVREQKGGIWVTVVAQRCGPAVPGTELSHCPLRGYSRMLGAEPCPAPGGAGEHVGGEVLQLIAEGAHPAEREAARELGGEVLRHVDAPQLPSQRVIEGGSIPGVRTRGPYTRSSVAGIGTGAAPRDAVSHRETGTIGRAGVVPNPGNRAVNGAVNSSANSGAGGRESEKRPRRIALKRRTRIQKNGIRSLPALMAELSECRIRGPAESPLARGNAATSGNREDPPAQRQRSGLHARGARIRGATGSVADPRVVQVIP